MDEITENTTEDMTKEETLLALANRLECSVDELLFLFEKPDSTNDNLHELEIPDLRHQNSR